MTKKQLLDQVRDTLCDKNYPYHTEQAYPAGSDTTIRAPAASSDTKNLPASLLLSTAFLYNDPQTNNHDVHGDQYPSFLFRESPVGVRGLDRDGEIPSAIQTFRLHSGQAVRRGTSLPQRQ